MLPSLSLSFHDSVEYIQRESARVCVSVCERVDRCIWMDWIKRDGIEYSLAWVLSLSHSLSPFSPCLTHASIWYQPKDKHCFSFSHSVLDVPIMAGFIISYVSSSSFAIISLHAPRMQWRYTTMVYCVHSIVRLGSFL